MSILDKYKKEAQGTADGKRLDRAGKFLNKTSSGGPISKEKRRELEATMLKPDPIKPFAKGADQKPISNLTKWSVQLVLGSDENYELFSKFFKVNQYKGANVGYKQLAVLFAFLKAMERGNLSFDLETKILYYCKGKNKIEL